MARKMVDQPRSKALVNEAWEQIKVKLGFTPEWGYIQTCVIVDRILEAAPDVDGRDITAALVLCSDLGMPVTMEQVKACMKRVDKGRQGVARYA